MKHAFIALNNYAAPGNIDLGQTLSSFYFSARNVNEKGNEEMMLRGASKDKKVAW